VKKWGIRPLIGGTVKKRANPINPQVPIFESGGESVALNGARQEKKNVTKGEGGTWKEDDFRNFKTFWGGGGRGEGLFAGEKKNQDPLPRGVAVDPQPGIRGKKKRYIIESGFPQWELSGTLKGTAFVGTRGQYNLCQRFFQKSIPQRDAGKKNNLP